MEKAIVVTTEYRGVFFGYGESELREDKTITLKNARMCVYWPQTCHGVLGLASIGTVEGSRVTPMIPSIQLVKVTAIMEATGRAIKEWEKEPWN